jgi:uncharacterized protein
MAVGLSSQWIRHTDDHLSLVAGISKSQIGELKKHTVTTAELAAVPLPLQWRPDRVPSKATKKFESRLGFKLKAEVIGCTQ